MSLKQTNVTVDIYRGFTVAKPYPIQGLVPAVPRVRGFLKHHLNAGRFGYQDPNVKWTHLLLLDADVDVRSAYNSWTGGAEATGTADTILLRDCPIPGNCCAFYAVMVQRAGRGSDGDCLRVYLDRVQPRAGGCFEPGVTFNCGACTVEPASWSLALGNDFANNGCSNCTILNNSPVILNYVPAGQMTHGVEVSNGCYWQSDIVGAVCAPGSQAYWQLRYLTGITFSWELQLVVAATTLLAFTPIASGAFNCLGPNTFTNPQWLAGTCTSASSATITRA